jgi:transposase InsO family protein
MSRKRKQWTVEERLEVVRARQNGLSLVDVQKLYGVGTTTVCEWVRLYESQGLPGLDLKVGGGQPRTIGAKIAAAEQAVAQAAAENPTAGVSKIQGEVYRKGFLDLARETVRKIMRRQGVEPRPRGRRRRNIPPKVKTFERANPNDLWQTDIMTFMLKAQYRVYMIGFMDDNSRFIVSWGLYRFQTANNVLEVFRAGLEKHGSPKEVLSDNGRQYHTWRGKSAFSKTLIKLGIRHVRSRPYHPQTCGKIESFWRNLYQELLSQVPLSSFEEAQAKIGEYVEYYNFKRPHQGIGNLIPADRYFRVANAVKEAVAENTEKLTQEKGPVVDYKPPTYIIANIGGKEMRLVAKDAEITLEGKVDGNTAGEAAEPAGADGADRAGAGTSTAGGGAVPAGERVEGVVLPVDGAGAAGGATGVGADAAGPEGDSSGGRGSGDQEAASAGGGAGEGQEAPARDERVSGAGGEDGEADHPEAGLGGAGGAV